MFESMGRDAEAQDAINGLVRSLVDQYLPAVVGLALRETVRTPAEQDALLALARLVANPMWPADQEAERSWAGSPCEDCGGMTTKGYPVCGGCAYEHGGVVPPSDASGSRGGADT